MKNKRSLLYQAARGERSNNKVITAAIIVTISLIALPTVADKIQFALGQAYPGRNGDMLFASNRDGDAEIYKWVQGTLRPSVVRVTSNDISDAQPSFSPDGSKIVFVSDRDRSEGEIYIMSTNGDSQRRITTNEFIEEFPSFSPDGSKILFSSRRNNNWDIFEMDRNGRNEMPLTTSTAIDGHAKYSPGGTEIVYGSTKDDPNGDIYIMDRNGNDRRRLTRSNSFELPGSWSPDGQRIAFTSNVGQANPRNHEIFVMQAASAVPPRDWQRLTNNPASDDAPSWSPDGSMIIFMSTRNGNPGNFVMTSDGGCLEGFWSTCPATFFFSSLDSQPMWGSAVRPIIPSMPAGVEDTDDDSIYDNIDPLPNTASNEFSDRPLGGTTTGTIAARGNLHLLITEAPNPRGVRVTTMSGGTTPATIVMQDTCHVTEGMMMNTIRLGAEVFLSCMSLDLAVNRGTVPTEVLAYDGSAAKLDVPSRNSISFDPTFATLTAAASNPDTLSVRPIIGGVKQEPLRLPASSSLNIDTVPPETTIDSVRDRRGNAIQDRSTTQSQDIMFEFSSPDTVVSILFECKLDASGWEVCTSGIGGNLPEGSASPKHQFSVRAIDPAGNVDKTPATWQWVVLPEEQQQPNGTELNGTSTKLANWTDSDPKGLR